MRYNICGLCYSGGARLLHAIFHIHLLCVYEGKLSVKYNIQLKYFCRAFTIVGISLDFRCDFDDVMTGLLAAAVE